MADQLTDQVSKFLKRGRGRRKPTTPDSSTGYKPLKQGQVAPFKPRKQSAKKVAKY